MIETALRGFPLRDAAGRLDVLLICVLGLAPALLGLRFRALWTTLAAVVLAAAHDRRDRDTRAHYVLTTFERRRTRDTFARFVPEQVVDQVLAQVDQGLRLGGTRVVGTCMFADLRDSTRFAESLPPETVVEVINRGTLMSYLGDGFMAVFGAPLAQDDHADRALAAARELLDHRLPRFNAWFRDQGYREDLRIGIGINSGPFLAGNVGSETRLEYTAMGDTIDTASRLEAATKTVGYTVLLSQPTRDALFRPADDLVEVGEVEIRGRRGSVRSWSLEGARELTPGRGSALLVGRAAAG